MMKNNSINGKEGLILIVDDIPKNLQLLGKTLRDEGYQIAAVSKPEQVLESSRKFQPDLILLDVMMPGKSGFEICKELKEDRSLKHIPVIFLTAKVEEDSVIKGLKIGGSDYVTKPFNTQELLARVDTHISLKLSKDLLKEKNEQLEELNLMKDRIYSVIGHDLRGPLNGIIGVVNMVLGDLEDNKIDTEKMKKFLGLVQQSSSNLWNLLSDLLSWARVQSKEMKVNETNFLLLDAIKRDVSMLEQTAGKKEVTINLNVEDDLEIKADKTFVKTIVRNFLSNALKFSNQNGIINIDISIDEQERLYISVTDNGIGMSGETQERLFKMTHPGDESEMNKHGAGFGLLLCNELAKLHGGELTAESKEGEGSVFTLMIPQAKEAVAAA